MVFDDHSFDCSEQLPDVTSVCLADRRIFKPWRIYVAHNMMLNKLAQSAPILKGLRPFVFKVGMSQGCVRRTETLNAARNFTPAPNFKQGRPIYAGVTGWRIGGCWLPPTVVDVSPKDYDSKVFWKWVAGEKKGAPGVRGVTPITYEFSSAAKHNGIHTAYELYIMEEEFLLSGKTGLAPHALHDEMLLSVRNILNNVIGPFLLGIKN